MVTGGLGFIGSHLVEKLLSMDEEVLVLSHPNPPENNYKYIISNPNSHRMNIVYSDMKDLHSVINILKMFKVNLVYHLAAVASHRLSIKDPYLYLENNYVSLLNLLEASRIVEPSPKIVFTSSSSVYGDHESPLREDLEPRPKGPYALSKFFGERLCKLYVELYGLDCAIIRYFNVVGERCRGNIVFKIFAEKISSGEPVEVNGRWIDGEFKPAQRDFTYISDAVEGTIAVGTKFMRGEIFNIGFGRPASVLRIAELMMENFGKHVKINFKELEPHESLVSYCDNSKARKLLGWSPKVDIEEMVKRYVSWFKSYVWRKNST